MNLYMSFSNLLEIWVTEGGPPNIISDPQEGVALEGQWEWGDSGNSLTLSGTTSMSKSDVGTEDSGVEITSSEAFLPSSSQSVSMCNTAIDAVSTSIRDEDGLPSTSPPCSPVLSPPSFCSSSSLSFCLRTRAQGACCGHAPKSGAGTAEDRHKWQAAGPEAWRQRRHVTTAVSHGFTTLNALSDP